MRTIPLREIRFRMSRSGGPGGQNVNKVETKVEACWNLEGSASFSDAEKARLRHALHARIDAEGALRVTSQRHRSQARNREAAILRLRELVQEALRPRRARRATAPTAASREGRLESKRRRSQIKRSRGRVPSDDT